MASQEAAWERGGGRGGQGLLGLPITKAALGQGGGPEEAGRDFSQSCL